MNLAVAESLKQSELASIKNETTNPVLLLTISNGAAHARVAEAIAAAWRGANPSVPVRIVEVSEYMSRKARFTHVTAYLWLLKNAPAVWGKIDAYQKRQTQTSPEWFYRRECRKLFALVHEIKPLAIVATEVGCGEIAALIKRDLNLAIPLIAVSLDYDADRAWIQPEVDLYCLATHLVGDEFIKLGASPCKIRIWGVPLDSGFKNLNEVERRNERVMVCERFNLNPDKPIVLVSGGGEGLGEIEAIVNRLLFLPVQIIILTGRNKKLKVRCESLGASSHLRVLGWTDDVPALMQAVDVLISKLGLTFCEAMTCGLPIIALEPPPGAEQIQYDLLEHLGVGRAVRSLEELSKAVCEMLDDKDLLRRMRAKTGVVAQVQAADKLADWLREKINA